MKKNAIRINWLKANNTKWKTLDEELSFILRTSLNGPIGVKLHSFTNIVHAVCLEHFGSEDQHNPKRTANRRQREKGQLRFEQRRLKKELKEIPGDKTLIKRQLSKIKEKILVISRAENARKRRLKKRKARRAFDMNPFKLIKKLFEEEKSGVLKVSKETLEAHLQRKYYDPLTDTPMGNFGDFNRPQPPGETFDNSSIKLGGVKDFVRKARSKSTPGINGISYKLYKRCPKVL